MLGKSQMIGHLTFCWPSQILLTYKGVTRSLSQILKGRCLQWYGYPRILGIPIPKNPIDIGIPFSCYLSTLD